MKILLDSRFYGLENAGLGRYTSRLVDNLCLIDKINKYIILLNQKYYSDLKLPENWKKVPAFFRHYSLLEQIKLKQTIDKENPDLVHCLNFNIPLFCSKPLIVTIHDTLMGQYRGLSATTLPRYQYLLKYLAASYIFKKGISKAYKIIVPSQTIKRELIREYKTDAKKIKVISEGVDALFYKAVKPGTVLKKYNIDKPYLFYVGNAYPHKNLNIVVKVISELNKKGVRVYFVIASARNIFTERLNNYVSSNGLEDIVKVLGFVKDVDLACLYSNSLAFIFPSLSEGFGLPGLEAMASGTLVLASEIPIFKEIYDKHAFYFDPDNEVSIEKSILGILSMSTKTREEKVARNIVFSKGYSWEKMALKTLRIYNSP